jgi:hypothetical protein
MTSPLNPERSDMPREVQAQIESKPKVDVPGYVIPDLYLGTRRPVRVLVIGSVTGADLASFTDQGLSDLELLESILLALLGNLKHKTM